MAALRASCLLPEIKPELSVARTLQQVVDFRRPAAAPVALAFLRQ